MSERYAVYAKSFVSDPWSQPIYLTDDLDSAQEIAYQWFDEEGWFAIVVEDTQPAPQIVYVDYWEPDNEFEFSPEALKP